MSTYNYNNYNSNSPGPGPNTPGPGPGSSGSQNDWVDVASWIIDICLCSVFAPLGVGLIIGKVMGNDIVGKIIRSIREKRQARPPVEDTSQYVHEKRTTSARTGGRPTQPSRKDAAYSVPGQQTAGTAAGGQKAAESRQVAKPEDGKNVRRPDTGAVVKQVFGWIIVGFGLLMTLSGVLGGATVWEIISTIAVALGGGLLTFSGRQDRKKAAAFRRCMTVSGDKGIVRLEPLAKTLGMTIDELEKQLSDMIDRGYYGERAYVDHARELLVIEPEFMRDVYRTEDEAKAKQAEQQAKDAQTEYQRLVEQIRQADIDIEDEVMSEKIRRMQAITEAIFEEVEKHPEKRPQIDRFMNYYLPTTLKLLESYARIEEQGVTGENTAKAKADIERIADTLVEGYSKQLDTLYRAEAVDIAGDVSVIESMMRRDGLTGRSDFRPFAQFVEKPAAQPAEQAKAEPKTEPEAGGQVMGGH